MGLHVNLNESQIMNKLYRIYKLRIIATYILSFISLVVLLMGGYFFSMYPDGDTIFDTKILKISTKNMGVILMATGVILIVYLVKSLPKLDVKNKKSFTLNANEDSQNVD